MPKELHIKNTETDEKGFIGIFESEEAISAYLAQLYNIVEINEDQFLLFLHEFSKEGFDVIRRHFIGCFRSKDDIQTFLNDSHEICEAKQ